ncbi:MAG: hypothetical protein ACTHLY_00665 [Pseudolabrys sp.]
MSDPAKSAAAQREVRLAAALRENLKRRKAQARARAEAKTEAKLNQTADTPEVRESPQSGGE